MNLTRILEVLLIVIAVACLIGGYRFFKANPKPTSLKTTTLIKNLPGKVYRRQNGETWYNLNSADHCHVKVEVKPDGTIVGAGIATPYDPFELVEPLE